LIATDDEDCNRLKLLVDSDRVVVREGFLTKEKEEEEEGKVLTRRVVYVWLVSDVLVVGRMIPGTGKGHLKRMVHMPTCQVWYYYCY